MMAEEPWSLYSMRAVKAGLWFSSAAAVAGFGFLFLSRYIIPGMVPLPFLFAAILAAFFPGMLIGKSLGDKKLVRTAGAAAKRGAAIVLCSHFLLPVVLIATGPFGLGATPNEPLIELVVQAFALALLSIVFAGLVTFPVGCIAAIQFRALESRARLPKGCAKHDYRSHGRIPELCLEPPAPEPAEVITIKNVRDHNYTPVH